MKSPGQFDHLLVRRAKTEIVAAALTHGVVPTHNVTTELHDVASIRDDARRAREEFGFLRMWSIHPNQIEPILSAMQPDYSELVEANEAIVSGAGCVGDRYSCTAACMTAPRIATTGIC